MLFQIIVIRRSMLLRPASLEEAANLQERDIFAGLHKSLCIGFLVGGSWLRVLGNHTDEIHAVGRAINRKWSIEWPKSTEFAEGCCCNSLDITMLSTHLNSKGGIIEGKRSLCLNELYSSYSPTPGSLYIIPGKKM